MKIQLCARNAQPSEKSCANLRVPIPFHLGGRSMRPETSRVLHLIEPLIDCCVKEMTELAISSPTCLHK